MNRPFWNRFANKSWKLCRSKVMKKCKAEYLLIKMILLKSLICKGCTFYVILFRVAEEMFTMHTLHAFGWIFFYYLEGCDSINFIDQKSLTLYCLITWNENYALMVIHYCRESQSCSITSLIAQTQSWITRPKLPLPFVLILICM